MRNLKNGITSGWIKSARPKGVIYRDDNVNILKGVGPKILKRLNEIGKNKVSDFIVCNTNEEEKKQAMIDLKNISGLSMAAIIKLTKEAENALDEKIPSEVNYLNSENPYEARYGENWRNEIKKVSRMKKWVCVTDLVMHIYETTQNIYKGTKYEDTFLFYHDALTQMTDKDCLNWMKKKGILNRWIRPVLGLNDEIIVTDADGKVKKSTRYKGRPVGDCPELMPLDNSLFRDLRTSVDQHVGITSMLPRDDKRRFSKATPKLIIETINRIWDPDNGVSPRPDRIVQDIERLKENIAIVIEAEGAIVTDVVDRNGHRRKKSNGQKQYRPKKEQFRALSVNELNLHKDAQDVLVEIRDHELAIFEKNS